MPKLLLPKGGYLTSFNRSCNSSDEFTIGAIRPSAPDSKSGLIQSFECETGRGKQATL